MILAWYEWIALAVVTVLIVLDCGVFYRNARRGKLGWLNLIVMTIQVFVAALLIAHGTGALP